MSGPDPRAPEVGEAVDDRTFRQTLGLFATGVSVIAAEIDGGVHAMTANAVTSVSLDPKLILFCPSRRARFSQLLPDVESFTVNFLRDEQQSLSTYFAGGWKESTPPPYRFVHDGKAPRLQGALATLHCCKHAFTRRVIIGSSSAESSGSTRARIRIVHCCSSRANTGRSNRAGAFRGRT